MSKFTVKYDMDSRGLTTLFSHRLFTINEKARKDWDYEQLESYLISYKLGVSDSLKDRLKGSKVMDILNEMLDQESEFVVKRNKGQRYSGTKQYIKCQVPIYVLDYLKKIFVSTLVYSANKMETKIPQAESITFEFDKDAGKVTITELQLYEPEDNPYYVYARNAVSTLSVEAVGLEQYSISNTDKVEDFYDWNKVSKWKEREFSGKGNENDIPGQPGVYMLYDAKSNEFYVGKAKDLKQRILQHAKNTQGNDPIPNFTHYRYSVINLEYLQFLYLIENASIHDCAWLLDMPKANKFTPALSKKIKKSLNDCKVVNTLERQRKVEIKEKGKSN